MIKTTESWAPPPENVNHRSPSREKKRARWEEEKDRWSDSQGSGKEKNYTSIKEKEAEEVPPEKTEEEEEELLKPVWIRCTHSESYYSSDPMDQVVRLKQRLCGPRFLHRSNVAFRPDNSWWLLPVHCRILGSIRRPYASDANSILPQW